MSKLQTKTLRIAMMIVGVICLASLAFFILFIYRPLRSNAIDISNTSLDNIVSQANDVSKSIREYTDYVAYGDGLKSLVSRYSDRPNADTGYEISDWLNQMRNLRTGVYSIALETEGSLLFGLTGLNDVEREVLTSPWYQRVRDIGHGNSFSRGAYNEARGNEILAYSRKYNMRNRDAIITVFIDPSEWFGGVERELKGSFDGFLWMYDADTPLYPNKAEPEWMSDIDKDALQLGANELPGGGILLVSPLMDTGYMLYAYMASKTLLGMSSRYILLIAAMLFMLLLSMMTAMLYISGHVSRPVTELSRAMERIIENDFNMRLRVDSDDEIGRMQSSFNMMSNELASYMQKSTQDAIREQQMKFGLLISQVDPHFFCNTLNTINYLARMGKTEDVAVASNALSNILRDRLRLKDFKVFDTVQQELETVSQYMRIQSYRYGDKVNLRVCCPDALMECLIPKNIIQPLVENSIFHGLADEEEGTIAGEISIDITGTAERLTVSVTDDGVGISEEIRDRLVKRSDGKTYTLIEKGHGIGLYGVLERLDILFGEEYSYAIERVEPHGTCVSIHLKLDQINTEQFKLEVMNNENLADHG